MRYVEAFVSPVPTANKDAYRRHAAAAAPLFREFGATRVVETWGDEIPQGKVTDFKAAVQAKDGEAVVYSWVEWPSKAARMVGWQKITADERMKPDQANMPFDGGRMVYGGFEPLLDE